MRPVIEDENPDKSVCDLGMLPQIGVGETALVLQVLLPTFPKYCDAKCERDWHAVRNQIFSY